VGASALPVAAFRRGGMVPADTFDAVQGAVADYRARGAAK
jgi:hypothetical protein